MLIGELTLALVRDEAEVEPVELAGGNDVRRLLPYRVLGVHEAPERPTGCTSSDAGELDLTRTPWQRVHEGQRCELVTVIGEAGVGKSRLDGRGAGGARRAGRAGRCLPYGEGITYWPVVEVWGSSGSCRPSGCRRGDPLAARASRPPARRRSEIAWAFRKTLEEQAPLVVVFDDVQWGEETLLDLVEQARAALRGRPILLVCLARPELLEAPPLVAGHAAARAAHRRGRRRAARATAPDGCASRSRESRRGKSALRRRRCWRSPTRTDELAVPVILQAVLAARLDRLDPDERRMLDRGAVEGETFHRGAVQALAPEETQVTRASRRSSARSSSGRTSPMFPGEDGYRFRHILIRDAAYARSRRRGAPTCTSASLTWLESRRAAIEQDEMIGYHLEQALASAASSGTPTPRSASAPASSSPPPAGARSVAAT